MIQDRLEKQLRNVVMETSRNPRIIVMHPQTWVKLVKEIANKDITATDAHETTMRYKGIKVFINLYLNEGEFVM